MKTAILIPARYASTRYPGKPLALLEGATGVRRSLIERSWRAAMQVSNVDAVFVATDDLRIKEAAEAFGASVLMTPSSCPNGTARCAAALEGLQAATGSTFDLIVNLQGDAPLTPHWFVEALITACACDAGIQMATPILRCDKTALGLFREDRQAGRVGGTTVVQNLRGEALYFSKEVVPYSDAVVEMDAPPVYHHVGLYAYRPDVLRRYADLPQGPLERIEGLEQLRFLENGLPISCVEVDGRGRAFWELNNPEDVPRIEAMLRETQTP